MEGISPIPSASVIIRNRNESQHLKHVLKALALQDVEHLEVIVVDNESTDDSVAVARDFGARVISLTESSFTYGRALNLGMKEANSDICVILSAHSLPLGTNFIRECLLPFDDPSIAAVRCVYAGKRADLTRWMDPEVLSSDSDFNSKGPLASGCAVRHSVWREVAFDEHLEAAEEKIWAGEVLKLGYKIHSPAKAFYFYLKEVSPSANLRKNYRELVQMYASTGARLGFISRSSIGTMMDLLYGIMISAPRSALAVVRLELLRAYLRMKFTIGSKRNTLSRSKAQTMVDEQARKFSV